MMAFPSDECDVPKINYFANPDVEYNNQATGNSTTNCARRITETMVKFTTSSLRVSQLQLV